MYQPQTRADVAAVVPAQGEAEAPRSEIRTKQPGSAAKEKRQAVRRDPEKRRLQNIEAQKRYRNKLKKRLDDLETLAASVVEGRQAHSEPRSDEIRHHELITPAPSTSDTTSPEHIQSQSPEARGTADDHDVSASALTESEPSWDLSLWDSKAFLDPAPLIQDRLLERARESEPWHTSLVACACPMRHIQVRSKHKSNGEGVCVFNIQNWPTLADPYSNTIRMEMVCTVAAVWTNCLQVGITEPMFCEDESISPFYRPGLLQLDLVTDGRPKTDDARIRTVQTMFRTLKPDLRPIDEQVTISHHPILDAMPFPTLRRNLLLHAGAIDEDDLCGDMLQGLICWGSSSSGSGSGSSSRAGRGEAGRSTGTPWDSRSWQARPWFLRKYWALVGGEDGELARQSEWWRGVRGEEQDIWAS